MANVSAAQGGRGWTATPSPATLDASSMAPALMEIVTAVRGGGASTVPLTTVQMPALGRGSASEILWTVGGASVRPDGEAQAILLPRTALSRKNLFVGTVKTMIKVDALNLICLILYKSLSPAQMGWLIVRTQSVAGVRLVVAASTAPPFPAQCPSCKRPRLLCLHLPPSLSATNS